ncbi:cytochrome c oxidase assembly factor CtaG [Aquibacillus koreensis]|uniref:Cytochrome c oxidase assembly factor CtaG n=1 Tax=Aquibacillus koreensis TaxID=279446 RepID=A0A9X3WNN0_9BACI|nr:cytochrome c oxidase assembly factor CtaG [Aquibacillus koreensis]MCT2538091.1 cytochrome c oxidase assembly factor CtaG [Aquibacillus koreensis]MDC3420614.1 cytochrome c oxidase assembly factor CtaG [Aquibacillus koreensis]
MWLELQIFGFRALWSPYYLLFVVGLGILYFLITVTFRHKFTDEKAPTTNQFLFFYAGLALLYIVKGSPIDLLSHIMFTSHMVQMALYYLVFPIFIIKGLPEWLWRKVFYAPLLKHILAILTKPLIALVVFNGLFSIYHIPTVFDYAKENGLAHAVITTVILVTAFLMWWPIFTPIKEMERLSPLLKIGYIFANGVLITPACGLIIFSMDPIYATYSETGGWIQALALCVPGNVLSGLTLTGPQMFSPLPIVEDQQLGGIMMKITQEIVYGIVLARIFFGWFNKESHKVDPIPTES